MLSAESSAGDEAPLGSLNAARNSSTSGMRVTPSTSAGRRPFSGYVMSEVRRSSTWSVPSIQSSPIASTGANRATAPSAFRRAACCLSNSSFVRTFLSANAAGRCRGTPELKFHTPCRSGCPSAVRGLLDFVSGPAADAAAAVSTSAATKKCVLILHSPSVTPSPPTTQHTQIDPVWFARLRFASLGSKRLHDVYARCARSRRQRRDDRSRDEHGARARDGQGTRKPCDLGEP